MKKLRLEELEVTTFETTAGSPRERGTVAAHAKPTYYDTCRCGPTDPALDCTYGCSWATFCPDGSVCELETA